MRRGSTSSPKNSFKYDTTEEGRASSRIYHSSSPSKCKFSLDDAIASGTSHMYSGLTSKFVVQGGTDQAEAEHQKFKKRLQV